MTVKPPASTLMAGALILFVAAAGFCMFAAWGGGPVTTGLVLLICGLAGVSGLGVLVLRGAHVDAAEDWAERLIQALPEPAALAAADGRIEASNAHWRAAMGESPRLPAGGQASALFTAFAAAGRGDGGRTKLSAFGVAREASVSLAAPGRFLVRLPNWSPPVAEAPATTAEPSLLGLDAFAAASPFGAALLEGADPFEATIIEVNPTLAHATGGGQVGQVFGELIEPRSRLEAQGRLARLAPGQPVEVRLAADATRAAHLYLARAGDRWAAYLVDVSGQKQIELQLAQSQKMQAIGQLAGGVAHDFNNLLTAILMQLDALSTRHPVGDPSYEGLNEIRQTSLRAADLVRKLLAFSRKQTVQREILDLGELISEFEVLLRRVLYEDVRLETDYGRNLPLVRADRGQLETAVMNLAVNARDAVRAGGGGAVRIRTARLTAAEAQALGYPDAEGDQALIEVADDGQGIAAEVLDKIFEPFFTTKPVGEGTGLGLATVYGIVKQADGWIAADSAPGEGARFRIFLPVYIPAMIEPAPPPAMPRRSQARDLSGAGRILFVEDEDAVRIVAARLLRARGYEVIEAASGEEALGIAEANAGRIDLMISDVVMPGMQGPDLLKQARVHLGEAPVMFISGYAEAEFSNLLEGERNVSFLPKPIDIKTLAERVKHELQKAS
ncbi:cell cycle histidine kinase CckA [Phenylobacterium immobile]|uniref:cell cycle histidine kinase CckA n=1 Tax=Phenylobacterium immobile TaxID=21 RepID=UPI000A67AF30|nr:ATP-binding protein [Phenylobacterium immobile]